MLEKAGGERIPVDLEIELKDGGPRCELDYGPSRNCSSEAVSAGSKGDVLFFRFIRSDGGWCDRLTNGQMSLELQGGDTLKLDVENPSGTLHESTVMERK